MQTFLPYFSFEESLRCLDYRRLGKQRVEAKQIIDILEGRSPNSRWRNHPAVLMWQGYEIALRYYYNRSIMIWIYKGFKNNMVMFPVISEKFQYPKWLGSEVLHASHRANLLRKDYEFYSKYNWKELPMKGYVWPVWKEEKSKGLERR